jgi:glyceraldehyde-3-phosphate dehydrogenase (NAD(P))
MESLSKRYGIYRVADVAANTAIRALKGNGHAYNLFLSVDLTIRLRSEYSCFWNNGEMVKMRHYSGCYQCWSLAQKNKRFIQNVEKSHFPGWRKNSVADVFFHGYAITKKESETNLNALLPVILPRIYIRARGS